MEKTNNLKLNVWEKTDPILVGDFNEDNRKIDAAVGALQEERIYMGSYVGDGKDNRTIDLPWEPKYMFLMGYILNYGAFSILTQTTHRYASRDDSGVNDTYHPKLTGNQITLKSKFWYNGDSQTIQYILFR